MTRYSLTNFLIDLLLIVLTGGLWLVWIIVALCLPRRSIFVRFVHFCLSVLTGGIWLLFLIFRRIFA